jgi:acyl-homoserine-lactone acylase
MATKTFTTYRTEHGPVVRQVDGRWVAVALMERPLQALMQSYGRTKAKNLAEFKEVMALRANSSNNTVYADVDGNIGYFHANFVPRRDPTLDWTRPVDGSAPQAQWRGEHALDDNPTVQNPPEGWIQNTNNWPYSAAGAASPKAADFAPYFDTFGENPRGVHATAVLTARSDFTLDTLIAAAYDSHLPELAAQVPLLVQAWQAAPVSPLKSQLAEPIALLRSWDHRWALDSVATSLAVEWAEQLWAQAVAPAEQARLSPYRWMRERITAQQRLDALAKVTEQLARDFGSWRVPWGELNRFQRLTPDLEHPFRDDAPSVPVAFAPGRWGSLASFVAPHYQGSKRRYGVAGNSFVAAVEFGPRLRARAVTAGGLSSDVNSRHFNDQAERYATGDLREVYFYPDQLVGHTERSYQPGR